jgi:hypothetical protein
MKVLFFCIYCNFTSFFYNFERFIDAYKLILYFIIENYFTWSAIVKKICILLTIILCIVSFASCSKTGNVTNVEIVSIESKIYSQEEILDAIEVVKTKFGGFTGCTLTKIGYIGDENLYDYLSDEALNNPSYIV